MKYYISGQITGLDLEVAKSIFEAKELELKAMGRVPVNPMKVIEYHPNLTWKDYMMADIEALFDCQGIVMLPNWKNSRGAKIEHDIAKHLELVIEYH